VTKVGPQKYFILIYDLSARSVQCEEFDDGRDAAIVRYSELEAIHRGDLGQEIVLVGADSLDTIKKTHSHYFVVTPDDLFAEIITALTARGENGAAAEKVPSASLSSRDAGRV
jgi:hypothetical protein